MKLAIWRLFGLRYRYQSSNRYDPVVQIAAGLRLVQVRESPMRKTKSILAVAGAIIAAGATTVLAQPQLIAVDSSRALYDIDMNTGAKTLLCTVSANAGTTGGLAYDRFSNTVYLTSTSLDSVYTLDINTCNATLIGAYGDTAVVMHGIEYDESTGTLYGASSHNGGLYNINTVTGAATLIGTSGLTSFTNLGYDSAADVMYATNSGSDSFYSINRATGAATLIGALNGPTNPNGLAYDWDSNTLFMVDNSTDNLYKIDRITGEANLVGSTGTGNLLGLMYIPEPATLSLMATGLVALARRRR